MGKPSALARGAVLAQRPPGRACRTSLSIPAGKILGGCTGSVHVERENTRAGESKQLRQAQGEGWFEDEVVAGSRSALDLHHVWNVRNLLAGGEGQGWGRWRRWGAGGKGMQEERGCRRKGGAEARANSFSSSVSFLCRQE